MTEKAEKPENFTVVYRGGLAHVERNFEFGKDQIQLMLSIKRDNVLSMSLTDLHIASLETAIEHLQGLLAKVASKKA